MDRPGPRVEVYRDKAGGWRWRLAAANNRIVADSAESYTRLHDAKRAARGAIWLAMEAGVTVKGD